MDHEITTLIFDWGGVLTEKSIGNAVYKALTNKTGCKDPITHKEFQDILESIDITHDLSNFMRGVNSGFECSLNIEEIKEVFRETVVYLPEILEFIKKLKTNYNIILFSNNHDINISNLKKYRPEILKLFDKIYFSCDYGIKKPSLDYYNILINELELIPKKCVFIDDKIENIEAGRKVGFNSIIHTGLDNLKEKLKELNINF